MSQKHGQTKSAEELEALRVVSNEDDVLVEQAELQSNLEINGVPNKTSVDFGEKFVVLGPIAEGGMGSVFKVQEQSTGKILAIKTLQIDLARDATARKRFEREAEAAAKLNHPNLVAVWEHGNTPDGTPYIVMDYLEGRSLADVLKEEKSIEPSRALNIFIQIAEGLAYAHAEGVRHRDIKPTNIILTKTADAEKVHLVDFGIAMVVPGAGRETRDLTQTGEVFGSPHYMSPEQCLGFMLDERSDIYSLGCLMYETLTGDPPFAGANPIQLVVKHIHDDPRPFSPEFKSSKAMERLEAIVLRCLQKEQAIRFQSTSELLSDLRLVQDGKAIPKYPRANRARPWLTKKQAIGALAIFCILLVSPDLPIGLPWVVKGAFPHTLQALICVGGIYVFISNALDRFSKLKKWKGTARQWSLIFLLLTLGLAGSAFVPYLLCTAVCGPIFWFPEAHPQVTFVQFISICSATIMAIFALASIVSFWLSRSEKKIGPVPIILRLLPLAIGIVFGVYTVTPKQPIYSNISGTARQAARAGFIDEAIALYKIYASISGDREGSALQIASIQPTDRAISTLTDCIAERKAKVDPVLYEKLAEKYLESGRLDKAELNATKSLSTDGMQVNPERYSLRGNIRGLRGNFEGAMQDFDKSIELDPGLFNEAYHYRIGMLCRFQQFHSALDELERMRRMNVDEYRWYLVHGLICEKIGDHRQARTDFEHVISVSKQLDPRRLIDGSRYHGYRETILTAYAYKMVGDDMKFKELWNENRFLGSAYSPAERVTRRLALEYAKMDLK